jgi:thiamine biosynthesis lipoprotein ApbE/flavin reductase (DIM6/NTAB) family NADH-FMN oxidoreductase RutF
MGCASSKPSPTKDPTGAAAARPEAKPARKDRVARSVDSGPAKPAAAVSYDAKSSASLSTDGSSAPVAFYGLLAGGASDKLVLSNRSSNAAPGRRVTTAVHPDDDSAAPASSSSVTSATTTSSGSSPGGTALVSLRGVAMTLPYTILVGGVPPSAEQRLRQVVDDVFADVNAHLNVWNPDSDIAALNEAPPSKAIPISPLLADLFALVDRLHDLSGGRFDPTAAVLSLAWSQSIAKHARPPMPADVAHLRHAVGWTTKVKRKDATKAARSNGNTVVDVDGIAKGHAVDLLFDAVSKFVLGCDGASTPDGEPPAVYVDWAGDMRAGGRHPSSRPWRTAVMRPPGLQDLFKRWAEGRLHSCLADADVTHFVDLAHPSQLGGINGGGDSEGQLSAESGGADPASDGGVDAGAGKNGVAMATSGDYFHMQKFGFHHIANPLDVSVMKAGASSIASVSILAASCSLADGLATAAMTFSNVGDATGFLDSLIRRVPSDVFGYCIVGRTPEHGTNVVTSPHFARASAGHPTDASAAGAGGPTLQRRLPQPQLDVILYCCPRVPCLLNFPQVRVGVQIDSLQSLSMDPEPFVTFTLPTTLLDSLAVDTHAGALTFTVGKGDKPNGIEPSSLAVRVVKVIRVDDAATVAIAAVTKASQGSAVSIGLNYASHSVSYALTRPVESSVFAQMTLVEKVKAVLRRVPGAVWIVVTEAVHGGRHALTASSVASSAIAPDVVSFNVMESNVFTAAFRGVGAIVQVYALDSTQEYIAAKFVEKSDMTDGDLEGLRSSSGLSMEIEIEHVALVKDHLLAVGRVRSASSPASSSGAPRSPLLWLDKKFERLRCD